MNEPEVHEHEDREITAERDRLNIERAAAQKTREEKILDAARRAMDANDKTMKRLAQ